MTARAAVTRSTDETLELARAVGELLRAGDVVSLVGELGAGKTVFARGRRARARRHRPRREPDVHDRARVRGPRPLVHVDVYRLDAVQELHDLGFDELVRRRRGHVVEWGDRVERAVARRPARRPPRRRATADDDARRRDRRGQRALVERARRRRWPRWTTLTCCSSALDTATPQVSVAIGADGAVLGEVRLGGDRRHAEHLAPAIEYLCRALEVELDAARRDRGRDRPRPVHGTARRRDDRQGDGPGAAPPGGRRGEPRPRRLPVAAHEPAHRRGARRPPGRGVPRPVPAGSRRRAARDRLRGRRARTSSSPTSIAAGEEVLLAGDGVARYREELAEVDRAEQAGPAFASPSAAALVELATAHMEREEFSSAVGRAPAVPPPERRRDRVGEKRGVVVAVERSPEPTPEPFVVHVVPMRRRHVRGGAAHRAAGLPAAVDDVALPQRARAAIDAARTSSPASDATSWGTAG